MADNELRGRRLCKIKIGKNEFEREVVTIKMEEPDRNGEFTAHLIECKDTPHPDLRAALAAMAEHLISNAEFPSTWEPQIDVISVTITHTNNVQGIVITGKKELENCNAPLIVNTPHYTREPYNEDDESDKGIFSTACGFAIDALEKEVIAYVDGKRAQQELDFGENLKQPDLGAVS